MFECYFSDCKYHSFHQDLEGGPFCYQSECRASPDEVERFITSRKKFLKDTFGMECNQLSEPCIHEF